MNKLTVKTQNDIPVEWTRLAGKRKTTVNIRPSNGVEEFAVSWQNSKLVSDPALDLIVVQDNGSEYPCKIDIFNKTYEVKIQDNKIRFAKRETSRLVEIPENYSVEIETLEGKLNAVKYPDYIAIGIDGELYANSKEFVDKNLELS